MADSRTVFVPDGLAGERADAGLARLLGFSRTKAAQIIAEGAALMDGVALAKSSELTAGALLVVDMPEPPAPVQVRAEVIEDMRIVYDDDDLVIISKPVGVAAHPSPGWTGPTVVGGLAGAGYRISTSGASERQGIVQRLDVGTSGLMMVAKSEHAYSILKNAFRHREVYKEYETVVQGLPDPPSGTIEAPIGRHPSADGKMAVTTKGKPSVTHYELIEAFRYASRLRVTLETGRTHQIRVHMAAVKHSCVGDPMYGPNPRLAKELQLTRQWLHAVKLRFVHPRTGEEVEFVDDLPEDLTRALSLLAPG